MIHISKSMALLKIMRYLPFLSGKYTTGPGLVLMDKAVHPEDNRVFQIDDTYQHYLQNKLECRKEDIHKYYCEKILWKNTSISVTWYLIQRMIKDYPEYFVLEKSNGNWQLTNKKNGVAFSWSTENELVPGTGYTSLFDAVCSQVQEDVAICQINREEDWLAAIHLCAPNYWAPLDKIGKPFNEVHAPVADMEKTTRHYKKMYETLVHKGPYTRFAWGIATDTRLNHHPIPPPDINKSDWQGRKTGEDKYYIRTERQNIIGFPAENAFLFTIRTFFYDMDSLEPFEKEALAYALSDMSPASLAYKGLTDNVELIKKKLLA